MTEVTADILKSLHNVNPAMLSIALFKRGLVREDTLADAAGSILITYLMVHDGCSIISLYPATDSKVQKDFAAWRKKSNR